MYEKYEAIRDAGTSPQDVYQAAVADGLGKSDSVLIIRNLFDLSRTDEVHVVFASLSKKYEPMRDAGASPHDIYRAAVADGNGQIDSLKLIRYLFDLSLIDAKEVMIVSLGYANSLDEHQERLANQLEKYLDELPDDDDAAS